MSHSLPPAAGLGRRHTLFPAWAHQPIPRVKALERGGLRGAGSASPSWLAWKTPPQGPTSALQCPLLLPLSYSWHLLSTRSCAGKGGYRVNKTDPLLSGGFQGSQTRNQICMLRTVRARTEGHAGPSWDTGRCYQVHPGGRVRRVSPEGMAFGGLSFKGAHLLRSWMRLGRRCRGRKVLLAGDSAEQRAATLCKGVW